MANYTRIHLLQFYRHELAPAAERADVSPEWVRPLYWAEFFEYMGWLAEGVFCSYFPARDAEVMWTRYARLLERYLEEYSRANLELVAPSLVYNLTSRLSQREPFPIVDQMPSGRERDLEVGLFGQALVLSTRSAHDVLARHAAGVMALADDTRWSKAVATRPAPNEVAEALVSRVTMPKLPSAALLVAGYLRLLEHMAASIEFFDFVGGRYAAAYTDFVAFRQRIGSLSAGQLPFGLATFTERFEVLSAQFNDVLRPEVRQHTPFADWMELTEALRQYVKGLKHGWIANHPFHLYATV